MLAMHAKAFQSRLPRLAKRPMILALAVMFLGLAVAVAPAKDQRIFRSGVPFEYELEGNPGSGYTWKLNKETSSGLDIVKVDSLGYRTKSDGSQTLVGQPAPFVFRITCRKDGIAVLQFDYVGPTGTKSKSQEAEVRCGQERIILEPV